LKPKVKDKRKATVVWTVAFVFYQLKTGLRQLQLFTTSFTLLGVGRAFAVIGFFDFATGLGHSNLHQVDYLI
jgi:hypothetical protein